MLRTMHSALLAAAMSMAVGATTAMAQDQELGEVSLDRPASDGATASRGTGAGSPGPLRFFGGVNLAVGGELKHEDADDGWELDPTIGLQGGVDYVVMDYFAIGGEMRFLFPKVDDGDRNFLWDLSVKPRGRYAFGNIPLEVYGAMPIGLTVAGIDGPSEGGPGWNIGIVGGATWFFNENMGVNAELGWVFHKFEVDEADYKMNQFLLLCPNFVYAL